MNETANNRGADREADRATLPAVDIFEDSAGITVIADLPGVPRDKLEVKVEAEMLLIEGIAQPVTAESLQPVYAEVRTPRFRRTFALSRELNTEKVDANLKDGVLTIRIPKQTHAQPRRIVIS
jgi:HSP20 family molecular chaperone IbpA